MSFDRFVGERSEELRLLYCELDPDIAPGARYGPAIRDIYVVECCVEGGGNIIINDREFTFGVGDCFVLFPFDTVTHVASSVTSRRCLWCAIDGLQIGEVLKRAGISSTSPILPREVFGEVKGILEGMISVRHQMDAGAEMRRTAMVYSLLGAILRGIRPRDKNIWVEKAIQIMNASYDRAINITLLASELGLDRSYFSTLFKERTGMSPAAYLNALRIRKACVLMSEQGCTVAEAANAVGIDPSNFSRIFKRVMGKSPREYNFLLSSEDRPAAFNADE